MDPFCLTSNTASPWFLPCPVPSVSPSVCLKVSHIICSASVSFPFFLQRTQQHELKQEERRKERVTRGGKPQSFLIVSRQPERGPEPPFPAAHFHQVKTNTAITYSLTPILTTDSTPNYHLPSMTILWAHPQLQRCRYLKAGTKTDNYHLCHILHTVINRGGIIVCTCVYFT